MNKKNLIIIISIVSVVLVIIAALMFTGSSEPKLQQKTDLILNITNSVVYLDIFMLTNITLDEQYFYDDEHLPAIRVEIWIPDEDAWIIWHVVKISLPEIEELIMSGEGFTKYIIDNGGNKKVIQEEVQVTEQGEYTIAFRQTNIQIGNPQPYDSRISISYWVFE